MLKVFALTLRIYPGYKTVTYRALPVSFVSMFTE